MSQSVRDALTDAEQLRQAVYDYGHTFVLELDRASSCGSHAAADAGTWASAAYWAHDAARAAFRLCPGLRGDR